MLMETCSVCGEKVRVLDLPQAYSIEAGVSR